MLSHAIAKLIATCEPSLTVSSFDFDNCTVTIEAAYAKNKKTVILPIKPDMATEVRAYAAGKLPTAGLLQCARENSRDVKSRP